MRSRLQRRYVGFALLVGITIAASACAGNPKPDTSGLSPAGIRTYRTLQATKIVNDVTTTAIAANRSGQLPDNATAQVLTVNKQVLDVITADPQSGLERALVIAKNAKDALPPTIKALVDGYLQRVVDILTEVK